MKLVSSPTLGTALRRTLFGAAATIGLVAGGVKAHAVVTSTWQLESYAQFGEGDATSAFINSLGEVRPGWDSSRVALVGDAAWSALRLTDGSYLIGSDKKGALLHVKGTTVKPLLTLPGAIAVVALAQGADGTVYATTMPGKDLHKIDVAAGKATVVASLPSKEAETIWSLTVAPDNTVYAGVGPSGKLFAVKGKDAKEVFATGDKRVSVVATEPGNNAIWFGTSDRALVFRYDPKTKQTRAVADFAGNEISSLAWDAKRSAMIVAANELQDSGGGAGKTPDEVEAAEKPKAPQGTTAKPPESGSKPGAEREVSVVDAGRRGAKKGKGAVFAVTAEGKLTQLHALTSTYITAVTVDASGTVYVAAADKGRIYSVDGEGTVATAFDVDERAVSQLLWAGKNLVFATDDATALYTAGGRASRANYVSDIFDGKQASTFGRLKFASAGNVVLETRSGNTAKPGPGWSEWQTVTEVVSVGPASLGSKSGKVPSPPARYLQFRAALKDDAAMLRKVTLYYVPQNQATSIESVEFEPERKDGAATTKDLAAKPRSPVVKLRWKIDNPDSDETSYSLEVRRDGDANWRMLSVGKAPLTTTSWEWNTETFADGWYRLRVTSSDALANTPDRAMTASFTTPLFTIDNTKPSIDNLAVAFPTATAVAKDALNTITEMAYAIDDGPWQLGAATDGIFDSETEQLKINIEAGQPALAKGSHTLAVRVSDAAGNIASAATTFVVK